MNNPSPWPRTSDAYFADLFTRYGHELESWRRTRIQGLPHKPAPGHAARLSAIDAYNAYMRTDFSPEQQLLLLLSPNSDWGFR
jgi:hypothetical protein